MGDVTALTSGSGLHAEGRASASHRDHEPWPMGENDVGSKMRLS